MSAEKLRELKTLASVCPELNMANYTEDDVRHLNDWAIEMSLLVEQCALRPERVPMTDDERGKAYIKYRKSYEGPRSTFTRGVRAAEAHHDITAQAKKKGV